MSILIEQTQKSQQTSNFSTLLKLNIKTVIKYPQYSCRSIIEQADQVSFVLNPSYSTLYLTTAWNIHVSDNFIKFTVLFINDTDNLPLYVKGQRLRLQLDVFLRKINVYILPENRFIVEPDTGIVKFVFGMFYQQFKQLFIRRDQINYLLQLQIREIKKYINEVTYFCLISQNRQISRKNKEDTRQCISQINKFRFLMRNTLNMRKLVDNITQMKEKQQNSTNQQIDKLMQLYLNHIDILNQTQFGLQEQPTNFENECEIINRNRSAIYSADNTTNVKKIVHGIIDVNPQKQQAILLSGDGAHSAIYKRKFSYTIVDTINKQVLDQWQNTNHVQKIPINSFLAYKACKTTKQSSINSFRNQIEFLKEVRDKRSPFIARYYLPIRKVHTQRDLIYMQIYQKNLYQFIKDHKMLSCIEKNTLSYRISKGLCFLAFNSICHRDFKPQNIVLDLNLNPKIIDFGSAVAHHNSSRLKVHDTRLLSTQKFHIKYQNLPQQLKNKFTQSQYEEHQLFDVYSFGKILNYIFFNNLNLLVPEQIVHYGPQLFMENLWFLINMCLNQDPDDRPGYGQMASFLGCLNKLINC